MLAGLALPLALTGFLVGPTSPPPALSASDRACLLSIYRSRDRNSLALALKHCQPKTENARMACALRLSELSPGQASDAELIRAIPAQPVGVAALYALSQNTDASDVAEKRIGELPYEFLDAAARAAARRREGYAPYIRLFFLTDSVSEELHHQVGDMIRFLLSMDKNGVLAEIRRLPRAEREGLCGGRKDPDCSVFLKEEERLLAPD